MSMVEVTTTVASCEEAERITDALLERRLVACGQWWRIFSRYRWQDAVVSDDEVMLVVKTRHDHVAQVREAILAMHPYDCPVVTVHECGDAGSGVTEWLDSTIE